MKEKREAEHQLAEIQKSLPTKEGSGIATSWRGVDFLGNATSFLFHSRDTLPVREIAVPSHGHTQDFRTILAKETEISILNLRFRTFRIIRSCPLFKYILIVLRHSTKFHRVRLAFAVLPRSDCFICTIFPFPLPPFPLVFQLSFLVFLAILLFRRRRIKITISILALAALPLGSSRIEQYLTFRSSSSSSLIILVLVSNINQRNMTLLCFLFRRSERGPIVKSCGRGKESFTK